MTLPWITDRPPTEKDAALDGTVIIGSTVSKGWQAGNWTTVKTGTPWIPFNPPEQPEPQVKSVSRGFTSLSVSMDADGDRFLVAIADDKTAWFKWDHNDKWLPVHPLPDREEVE